MRQARIVCDRRVRDVAGVLLRSGALPRVMVVGDAGRGGGRSGALSAWRSEVWRHTVDPVGPGAAENTENTENAAFVFVFVFVAFACPRSLSRSVWPRWA